MADMHPSELLFRRSSRCTTGGCVEVALLPGGGAVLRHSWDRTGEPLKVDKLEWFRFVSSLKNGEFEP